MGVTLRDTFGWGFPFGCRESSKDEILGGLNDSQSPSLLIAASVKISALPPVSGSIINPLESSLRELVSNELDDHLPLSRDPKGLGS